MLFLQYIIKYYFFQVALHNFLKFWFKSCYQSIEFYTRKLKEKSGFINTCNICEYRYGYNSKLFLKIITQTTNKQNIVCPYWQTWHNSFVIIKIWLLPTVAYDIPDGL